jgi:hypothetical protein
MRFQNYIPTKRGESCRPDLLFFIDLYLQSIYQIGYGQYIQKVSAPVEQKLIVGDLASYLTQRNHKFAFDFDSKRIPHKIVDLIIPFDIYTSENTPYFNPHHRLKTS